MPKSRLPSFGLSFDREEWLLRYRWSQTIGFPCVLQFAASTVAPLWHFSRTLGILWALFLLANAGMMLSNAVRGWALWWRRRSR